MKVVENVEYQKLMDGDIYAQWQLISEKDMAIRPIYTKLFKDLDTAIKYLDNLQVKE